MSSVIYFNKAHTSYSTTITYLYDFSVMQCDVLRHSHSESGVTAVA